MGRRPYPRLGISANRVGESATNRITRNGPMAKPAEEN